MRRWMENFLLLSHKIDARSSTLWIVVVVFSLLLIIIQILRLIRLLLTTRWPLPLIIMHIFSGWSSNRYFSRLEFTFDFCKKKVRVILLELVAYLSISILQVLLLCMRCSWAFSNDESSTSIISFTTSQLLLEILSQRSTEETLLLLQVCIRRSASSQIIIIIAIFWSVQKVILVTVNFGKH